MDTLETNLNGLDPTALPPLVPGVENDFIKVNSTGTDYILSETNTVPTPSATNQVLNSTTAGGAYSWTNEPNAAAFRAGSGSSAGFIWGTTNNNRISCQTSTNTITIVAGSGNRITVTQDDITFALPTTAGSLLSCIAGLSNTGTFTQNGTINHSNGQTANFGTSGTGNTVNIYGTVTANKIKHNDTTGTAANATIQLDGINTGIYTPGSSQMSVTAGGTECINFQPARTRTINVLELGRSLAPSTTTYNAAGVNTIFGSSTPFILCLEPASGTIDLDFQIATNYFGNQQFNILVSTRANSGGSVRYRAQSDTIHLTGGILTTITTNTYHTLNENRLHLVICNTDGNRFYLIQY